MSVTDEASPPATTAATPAATSVRPISTSDVIWSSNSIEASQTARALLFESRGLLFALAADSVTEVTESPATHAVPGSPVWFCGVSVYRTRPVPVIDVARYFQPDSPELVFNRAIVVRLASSSYVLAAEKILNLSKLPAGDYDQQHSGLYGTPDYARHRAIRRVCQHDNRLLALIDLPELLRCTKLLRECVVS